MRQEQCCGAHVGRRALVQKSLGIRSETIRSVLLGQEAVNRQEIAKDSNPFLTGACASSNLPGGVRPVCYMGENFQFDTVFNSQRQLIRAQRTKEPERSRPGREILCSHA